MHYSKEIVTQAREELARRRADVESENAAALEQAYQRLPQLRQIDVQLRTTMAKAAQAVFLAGGDAEKAMEQAKQENLALQARRRALLLEHLGVEEPERKTLCPNCGGNGYVGADMCPCLLELCRQIQKKQLAGIFGGAQRFENFSLDYYSDAVIPQIKTSPRGVMEKNLRACREFAAGFPHSGNLMLSGGTGLGKTHLAVAIGTAVAEQGFSVCYETAAGLFAKLEKARFTPSEEARQQADSLSQCHLLIIDDLGTELPGQFVTAALYELLNQRLMAGRSMVVTTNLLVEEMGSRYNPQIASRLYGQFRRLHCLGSDIRVMKNREGMA